MKPRYLVITEARVLRPFLTPYVEHEREPFRFYVFAWLYAKATTVNPVRIGGDWYLPRCRIEKL